MMKKLNKKKKGFTLIELVIVLAVLAIIALIAIPNFTKVRNDSLLKADNRTAEQIEKITLMAIADKDIILPGSGVADSEYVITPGASKAKVTVTGVALPNDDYATMLKEVKEPQVNGKKAIGYMAIVTENGDVTIKYGDDTAISKSE